MISSLRILRVVSERLTLDRAIQRLEVAKHYLDYRWTYGKTVGPTGDRDNQETEVEF